MRNKVVATAAAGFLLLLLLNNNVGCYGLSMEPQQQASSLSNCGSTSSQQQLNRRSAIQQGAADLLALSSANLVVGSLSKVDAANAEVEENMAGLTVPKDKAVLVFGANGGTGTECVSAALVAGRPCVAATRSGSFVVTGDADEQDNKKVSVVRSDVSSLESVRAAIQGTKNLGAVVFAASVGSKGGDAFAVDKDGVLNVAQCCIDANVPRFVIVSSGAVTKPSSPVYLLLNTVGKGIMEAKIQGEDGVREMYASASVKDRKLGYTIIRPGGLTKEPALGVGALELNQGDNKSGRISRADVASLCIKCLDSPASFDTTFECYETLTAKPLESVGLSNIFKSKDPTTVMTGFERRGETWDAIFEGLSRD